MLKIFHLLFKESFFVLKTFNKLDFGLSYKRFNERSNFRINYTVFKNLNFPDIANHQFYLNFINDVLKYHNNQRIFLFKLSKKIGIKLFVTLSFLGLIKYSLFIFFKSILLIFKDYKANEIENLDLALCIGFPSHSFNKDPEFLNHPNSFIEFLYSENLIKKTTKILTLEEYIRHSKSSKIIDENKINRFKIKSTFSFKKGLGLLFNFKKYLSQYSFSSSNIFFKIYLFYQILRGQNFLILYKKLLLKNNDVKDIFVLHGYDLGILFQNDFLSKIKNFNYSQNNISPSCKIFHFNNFEGRLDYHLVDVLKEFHLNVFSHNTYNQINFNTLNLHLEKVKTLINENFNINICSFENKYVTKNFSNLGYEKSKKIELKSSLKNLLIFDVPPESNKRILKRSTYLDIFSTKKFVEDFLFEIISVCEEKNFNIYYKPKYSLNNLDSDSEYFNILSRALNSKKLNLILIDPYVNIQIKKIKFDFLLNAPFTSTYYTAHHLSLGNYFYVPNDFCQFIDINRKEIIFGKEKLKKLINYA